MNLLNFKNAEDMLDKTGFTVEKGLKVVEAELTRLKGTK